MQRSSGNYLSFLVALLWLLASADINTLGVRGLHVGNSNSHNNKNNNKNNQQRNVYYTSSSRSRCYSPRAVASPVQQQTGFNNKERSQHRAGLLVDVVVEHDDYLLHQAAPLLIPFDANKDAKTIKIISYSPTILLTTIDSLNDDFKQRIQAENSKKEKTEVPLSSTIATASTTSTTSSGSTTTTTSSGTTTKVPPSAVMKLGCALAMNAGFLNGLGLSGILGRAGSVAAVTGTFTSSAVAFSSNPAALLTVLSAPLCYMLGSFTNGVLNPEGAPMDVMNLSWVQSSPLLLAGSLMVLLANTLSTTTTPSVSRTFCLLTFALGLQNSFTSHLLSGNLLRTTHMSGMTSDIGSVLGQVVRGNTANAYKLPIFAKLTASFWAGGMLSVSGTKYILSTMSGGTTAAASSAAGPIGCALSALLYFGLWTAWTEPLRRGISARISSPLLLCAKRLLYPQVVIASMRRGRHHHRPEDQHSYLSSSSSSSSSWGVLQ